MGERWDIWFGIPTIGSRTGQFGPDGLPDCRGARRRVGA